MNTKKKKLGKVNTILYKKTFFFLYGNFIHVDNNMIKYNVKMLNEIQRLINQRYSINSRLLDQYQLISFLRSTPKTGLESVIGSEYVTSVLVGTVTVIVRVVIMSGGSLPALLYFSLIVECARCAYSTISELEPEGVTSGMDEVSGKRDGSDTIVVIS